MIATYGGDTPVGYLFRWFGWLQLSRDISDSKSVSKGFRMTTAIYAVKGLTCGYCVAEVLENVHSLSSVTDVAVGLVKGGQSQLVVTSQTRLATDAVREAVESAGFDLTTVHGQEIHPRPAFYPTRQDQSRRSERKHP